jgi:hypothetical protein
MRTPDISPWFEFVNALIDSYSIRRIELDHVIAQVPEMFIFRGLALSGEGLTNTIPLIDIAARSAQFAADALSAGSLDAP